MLSVIFRMAPKTRNDSSSGLADIVGSGERMLQTELPTLRAVLRHGIFLQEMALLEEDVDRRNFPIKELAVTLPGDVIASWRRANKQFTQPVIIANSSVERKIQVLFDRVFPNLPPPLISLKVPCSL